MLPEVHGLTPAEFRRHPLRQVIAHAAQFGTRGLPSAEELDALKLPPATRRSLLNDCREVAAIHDDGTHADAWNRADVLAAEIVDALPDELAHPDEFARRLRPPDPIDRLSPAELADRVHA